MKILKKLTPKTSCGIDGISSEVLKMGATVLCIPLTLIINISILSGKFPSQWKQSNVSLYSRRVTETVSLLSVSGMVLEKVVANQIEDFFEANRLLGSFQHGFRKHKSTISELLELFDSIMEAKDNRNEIVLLMYDLSAAFDTVSHKTLVDKLEIYGFDEHSIKWMKSYLNYRTQLVNIQGCNSSTQEMPTGTPQGSRLSPLLFICLMADLDMWTNECTLSNFPDDIQSLCISETKESVVDKTTKQANNIMNFFTANDLVNNADKAHALVRI